MKPKSKKDSLLGFSKLPLEIKRHVLWGAYMDEFFNRGNEFNSVILNLYDKFNIDRTNVDPTLSLLLSQLDDEQLIELSKEFLKTNESVKDKMKPKSKEDLNKIIIKSYGANSEIIKFLNENGYEYAEVHFATYDIRNKITFEFYNKDIDWRIYFHPDDSLEEIKSKIK